MVICLERVADLHTARLMPLPLTVSCSSKSRLVLPFWYRLTRVVPEKGPINRCVCVCTRLHLLDELCSKHGQFAGDCGGREDQLEALSRHHLTENAHNGIEVLGVVSDSQRLNTHAECEWGTENLG